MVELQLVSMLAVAVLVGMLETAVAVFQIQVAQRAQVVLEVVGIQTEALLMAVAVLVF
jgi:hypothetical protein